jgi:hypothetical protein
MFLVDSALKSSAAFDSKSIKVDHELISVESFSDKWVASDGNSFYYDINKVSELNNLKND